LGYPDIGFRDDGIASETDIVVIGDSFTACVGVEIQECWVEIIEKKTSRDFANLGVLDYGPQQELQMLERYGLPLKPKVILWVFFANDVNDAWRFKEFGKGAIRGEFLKNPIQSWLIENSAVYTVLTFSWYNRYLFYNLSQTDGETAPQDTDLIWWLTNTDLANPMIADGFERIKSVFLEASKQVGLQAGTKFAVVIIPFREQVKYTDSSIQPRLDNLSQELIAFFKKNNITVIDLTPGIREKVKNDSSLIYFQHDLHLNVTGNEIVAEVLAKNLPAIFR
jgi:hypothetical protein